MSAMNHDQASTPTSSKSAPTVAELAAVDRLLVVCDFDGTLAWHSSDRLNVPVDENAIEALRRLALMPGTDVVILSGRMMAELSEICPLDPPVRKVGSHGAEPEGSENLLTDGQQAALDAITEQLEALCEGNPCFVEFKPFQRGLHYRPVAGTPMAEQMRQAALNIDPHGAHITDGRMIVEFSVSDATKGTWIAAERERLNPDATVFLGDDTTDERGFAVLSENDLGVKVGEGETKARARVADIPGVAAWLTELADARAARA
ncbi:trehalose-phosphatase [Corynebacterium frankenforstense]